MLPVEQARFGETFDNYVTWKHGFQDSASPLFEARDLFALLANGDTVEEIRRLIEVPTEVEATLRAFIRSNPEESLEIEHALWFRQRVAEEFERLLSI
jgi:hypothetical protein